MIVFRRVTAIILVVVLVAVFAAVMAVTLALRAVSDGDFVPDLVRDTGVYDFVYDDLLEAVATDIVVSGIAIDVGDGPDKVTLKFDEPERAKAALKTFVEAVLPREYVEREIGETFNALVPYLNGSTDKFTIDVASGERILAVPDALRAASAEMSLGEMVSHYVVSELVRQQVEELALSTLGITITGQEAVDAAVRVLPADWIEARLFEAADEMAPYFAGQADSFEVNVPLSDRAKIVGEVLKEKLRRDNLFEETVFGYVAGPLISDAIGGVQVLSFNVEITPEEIESALREVAPPEWLNLQGERALDAVIAYIASESDGMELEIDLADRKVAAVPILKRLAEEKLLAGIGAIPSCRNAIESQRALSDLGSLRVPKCQPTGLNLSALAAPFLPLLLVEIDRLVAVSVPDSITYTDVDFRSTLGPEAVDALRQVRKITATGISFSDEDLYGSIGDAQSRSEAKDVVDRIRTGASWDQDDLLALIDDPDARATFDKFRSYGGLITPARAIAIAVPILLVVLIGVLGGRTWPDRTIWAGAALTVAAGLFFLAIHIGTGFGQEAVARELDRREFVGVDFRNDFPATANLIESPATRDRIVSAAGKISDLVRDTSRPWLIAGVLVLAAGITFRVLRSRPSAGKAEGPRLDESRQAPAARSSAA